MGKTLKRLAAILATVTVIGGSVVLNSSQPLTHDEYSALIEVYNNAIEESKDGKIVFTDVKNADELLPRLNQLVVGNDPDAKLFDNGKLTPKQRKQLRQSLFDRAQGKPLLERSIQ